MGDNLGRGSSIWISYFGLQCVGGNSETPEVLIAGHWLAVEIFVVRQTLSLQLWILCVGRLDEMDNLVEEVVIVVPS
jgi:hypothetical protein